MMMVEGIVIIAWVGGQIAVGSAVGTVLGWEVGKKLNVKRHGHRSRFAPKDMIIPHKDWSELK